MTHAGSGTRHDLVPLAHGSFSPQVYGLSKKKPNFLLKTVIDKLTT
jgi:hypothetical protein